MKQIIALVAALATTSLLAVQAKKYDYEYTWWKMPAQPAPTVIVQAPQPQITPVESMLTQHEMQAKIEHLEERERDRTIHMDNSYQTRILELERKVAGMQKQITIMHAKKADK